MHAGLLRAHRQIGSPCARQFLSYIARGARAKVANLLSPIDGPMNLHRLSENWTLRLTAVFAAVHALYYIAGIRFIDTTLIEVMHFIGPLFL